ncbi:MAG: TIGR03560 family F420-dependent LLM class oxidoreductase [Pseudomonadales bacterium]|nr:TIGR03560 family F420-dependent LLM class oxidoreductase [Pseudomonadales bacterium]
MSHPSHPEGVRFGIHAGQQNTTFDEYLKLWQTVESLGFDWASVFDHFLPIQSDPEGPCFDGLTLLSALAAQTSTIRCGVIVVGVTYRNPAVLANIATTIDHVSGGRLELGLGGAWYELEHNQYNAQFPRIGTRLDMLDEAMQIVKSMWTRHRSSFAGKHFTIEDALCEPKPVQQPHPPLWVGGMGEKKTLRVVAAHADGWNTFLMPRDAYQHKLNILADHAKAVGRDPDEVRKQLVVQAVVGDNDKDVEDRVNMLAETRNASPEQIRQRALVGTAEQVAEILSGYTAMGVRDFLIGARPPAALQTLELIATKVAPAVKAAV